MKLKLDENIPWKLGEILNGFGHDTETVFSEGLNGKKDSLIFEETKKVKRFFITQDMDFSDVRKFEPGTHPGILLVRLKNPGKKNLLNHLKNLFETENVENWAEKFLVVTENKIRVVKPR